MLLIRAHHNGILGAEATDADTQGQTAGDQREGCSVAVLVYKGSWGFGSGWQASEAAQPIPYISPPTQVYSLATQHRKLPSECAGPEL